MTKVNFNSLGWLFLSGILFLLFMYAQNAIAVSCVGTCPINRTTTLTDEFSASENTVGRIKTLPVVSIPVGAKLRWNAGTGMTWGVFGNDSVPAAYTGGTSNNFHRIDDYISAAVSVQNDCRTLYVPYNVRTLNEDCSPRVYPADFEDNVSSRNYIVRIRLDKKIVSGTYSRGVQIAQFGFCQQAGCQNKGVTLLNLYVNLNITAAQTCTLNAGQVINIDFGNISSGAFTTAGARPEGVNDIVRNVNVSCDNIAPNTAMTVRLQADKVSGKAVVTNTNNDVGFVVADGNGTALTPNNLSSVIPFTLDSYGNSNVTIRVYPVSVTGNKPAEGPVTSQAYLRVDFA
ncbi:fimbrial protein [Serratia nevei]|uniref:fimbrial protein n=1 Tax=Serratia nevei TaxID=2703794 RepID=UPI003F6B925A